MKLKPWTFLIIAVGLTAVGFYGGLDYASVLCFITAGYSLGAFHFTVQDK